MKAQLMKIELCYRWRIFTIHLKKYRGLLALWFVKRAGHIDSGAVEKFAFMYVQSNHDRFQDWLWDQV